MNKLIYLAARLYPQQWRARYGAEFDALLEDVSPRFGDLLNIMKGALFMQFTRTGVPVTAAAFAGLGLLAAGLFCVASPTRYVTTQHISVQADNPEAARANAFMVVSHLISDSALTTLIETNGLYTNKFASPADRLNRFKQDLALAPARNSGTDLDVSFMYPDGQKARNVTAAFAQLIVDRNLAFEEQRTTDSGLHRSVQMQVAGPPQRVPRRRNLIGILVVGLFGGVLTDIAVVLLRRVRGPQVAH
jgi:hypothetical protein